MVESSDLGATVQGARTERTHAHARPTRFALAGTAAGVPEYGSTFATPSEMRIEKLVKTLDPRVPLPDFQVVLFQYKIAK